MSTTEQKDTGTLNAKWIPFTFEYDEDLGAEIISSPTPEEGQEILISDGKYVWIDTFLSNGEEYYLDSNQDFRGLAWMPKPDPKF